MSTLAIVPYFNVFEDGLFSHDLGLKILLIDQLRLEVFKEAFRHGIVPAVAFSAHALQNQRSFFQQLGKAMTSILHPSVRMKDQLPFDGPVF